MTGMLKNQLDLGFGQPEGSQVLRSLKRGKLKNQLDLGFSQPKGSQVLRSKKTDKLKMETNSNFGKFKRFPNIHPVCKDIT